VTLQWSRVAPNSKSRKRPKFNGNDPAAYNWGPYDTMVTLAKQYGIGIDFILSGGSPLWAQTKGGQPNGYNPYYAWWPNVSYFQQFATAAGKRYSGSYKPKGADAPLPKVSFWTLWNEPNFGEDLGPQAINGSKTAVGPMMYRNLLDAGWKALQSTGHGRDTILIGETTARGVAGGVTRKAPEGYPGNYGQTKPLIFIRTLYCVDANYKPLRGSAASSIGCPTTSAGTRGFRKAHPGLFSAKGWGVHPYPQNLPPTTDGSRDPDYITFNTLPRAARALDRLQRIYGSRTRFPLYNDEYGYITNPPVKPSPAHPGQPHYVSPTVAATYINQAEYLSWKSSRIKSYMQYPLYDSQPVKGQPYSGFASGLFYYSFLAKPSYSSYRLALWMPVTSSRKGRSLEIWGNARPALYESKATGNSPQFVSVQFKASGSSAWQQVAKVHVTQAQGYFDIHQKFSSSGSVRLQWTYPTAAEDLLLPLIDNPAVAGTTVTSRTQNITLK
jgi:hypothetical protein